MNGFSVRARLLAVAVGLLAVTSIATSGGYAAPAAPSLTLNINLNGGLEVVLGNGTRIRTTSAPGAVIPPGPYLVIVHSDLLDSQDTFHLFHLVGPGVSIQSDLLPCENPYPLNTIMFQASSVFTYDDARHPELGAIVFSTSSSGSSSDTGGGSTGGSSATSSGTTSNTSPLSKTLPFRGALAGSVGPGGAMTLLRGGASVSSLQSGRYRLTIADSTSKAGLSLEKGHGRTLVMTGKAFVGKRVVTVSLTPGSWTLLSSASERRRFTVVS